MAGREETSAEALVAAVEGRLQPLSHARSLAWWDSQIDASEENERKRAETELAWSDALVDSELFVTVERALSGEADASVRRRLQLARNLMVSHQVPAELRSRIVELESSVEVTFTRHRGVVHGVEVADTEIKRILRRSDDADERRQAWEAAKTVGAAVADDVRRLARLRNEAARALGHRDWFALSLAMDEVDEGKLLATLADADRVTSKPFVRWKGALDARLADRFGCSVVDLRPWHYGDPFFQDAPPDGSLDLDPFFEGQDIVALSRRTFEGVGLEVDGILSRSDLYSRPGKCQHAFCIDVDRQGDVRVLANVVGTHDSANTMLHELGHGVYDLGFDSGLPWLLRDTHLVATEASALLFGGLATSREWLEQVLAIESSEGAELMPRLRAARAADLLVFTRWVLVMNAFERALYADPDGDLDSTWWELVAGHQRVTPPDGRQAPDWAAKIHIAVSPVYYHTYLYGAVVALQLEETLDAAVGGLVDRPEAGALLTKRLFAPGESVRWDRLVEQASGALLSVEPLAREVAAA
jgi:peptidyl-dipeptidase A